METVTHNFTKNDIQAGTVELALDTDGNFLLNGTALPAESVQYLIWYGVKQSLADSYASAKTESEIKGAYDKKLDKIYSGNFRVESGSSGKSKVDNETRAMLTVGAEIMQSNAAAQWKALPKAKDDKETRDAKIIEFYERYSTVPAVKKAFDDELARLSAAPIKLDLNIEL